MGFLANVLCDLLYAPAVKEDERRGHESFRRGRAAMLAQLRAEATEADAYYTSDMIFPMWDYWSDGSVKFDKWTKKSYPKGLYFLDSHGLNTALRYGGGLGTPPPGAKRCPG